MQAKVTNVWGGPKISGLLPSCALAINTEYSVLLWNWFLFALLTRTQQFSFLKPLEFCWISANGRIKFKKTQHWWMCDRKEMLFLHFLSKPFKLVVCDFSSFCSKDHAKPVLRTWNLGLLPWEKSQTQKKKSLSKGLVSTIQLLQKKTSDRYCLTQKPVSLPRDKSWYTSMDVPMLPSHLRLLIAWSCSSNQQMEERLDCHKHTKDGQALLCSTPGGSWLLLMALVKEKLWTLYYYVFLLFLIVSKVETYF